MKDESGKAAGAESTPPDRAELVGQARQAVSSPVNRLPLRGHAALSGAGRSDLAAGNPRWSGETDRGSAKLYSGVDGPLVQELGPGPSGDAFGAHSPSWPAGPAPRVAVTLVVAAACDFDANGVSGVAVATPTDLVDVFSGAGRFQLYTFMGRSAAYAGALNGAGKSSLIEWLAVLRAVRCRHHLPETVRQRAEPSAAKPVGSSQREISFATYLLEHGHELQTLQEVFGPREVSTVIYTHGSNRGPGGVRSLAETPPATTVPAPAASPPGPPAYIGPPNPAGGMTSPSASTGARSCSIHPQALAEAVALGRRVNQRCRRVVRQFCGIEVRKNHDF